MSALSAYAGAFGTAPSFDESIAWSTQFLAVNGVTQTVHDEAVRFVARDGPAGRMDEWGYMDVNYRADLLFHDLPLTLRVGDRVSVKQLQRAGSTMSSTALTIIPMKPYTRAVHDNYAGADDADVVRLSALSFANFVMWRVILTMGFNDARLLSVSWYLPLYAHMPHGTDPDTWSLRMSAQADLVGTRMRCTTPFGMTLAPLRLQEMTRSPAVPWLGEEVPRDIQYRTADGKPHALDINLFEAIAVIACLIMIVQHMILQRPRPTYTNDNSSASWWPQCIRVGSIIQLAHHSEATQRRQGNWSTTQGMLAYA